MRKLDTTTDHKIFYISDLHIGHKNVLVFDNRPFKTIEEHDAVLMENWNNTVSDKDEVYLLGDISWKSNEGTFKYYNQLNGTIHWILGNHDLKMSKNNKLRSRFETINDYEELQFSDGKFLVLSHYPIPCFNRHYYGAYHFYGHVHTGFEWNMMENVKASMAELYDVPCNMFNVGCMIHGYTPRTFEEIINKEV